MKIENVNSSRDFFFIILSAFALSSANSIDHRYLAKEAAELWIVAANHDVNGVGDGPGADPRHTSEPLPTNGNTQILSASAVDSMEVGDVDDDEEQSGVDSRRRPDWKGKKRAVAPATAPSAAVPAFRRPAAT